MPGVVMIRVVSGVVGPTSVDGGIEFGRGIFPESLGALSVSLEAASKLIFVVLFGRFQVAVPGFFLNTGRNGPQEISREIRVDLAIGANRIEKNKMGSGQIFWSGSQILEHEGFGIDHPDDFPPF